MKTTLTFSAFLLVFCGNINAQAVNIQDSLALVDIYNSTNGPNWKYQYNWLNGPVNTWQRVTVTGDRVTAISIGSNNLSGTLPASIGNLTKLTDLSLIYGTTGGSIPSSIGNLTELTSLNLSFNQFTGSIPSTFGNLQNLQRLILGANQLSGSIPAAIGQMQSLTTLYLYTNQLSGNIPSELGNLSKLTNLTLHTNQLSGSIPAALSNITTLSELYLENNQLSGNIPPELGNLSGLVNLHINNNKLTGSIPKELGLLYALRDLDLSFNQLTGFIPPSICAIRRLDRLMLNNNKLRGKIPPRLAADQTLFMLNLSHNKLSGEVPASFSSQSFTQLNLGYNEFTFTGLETLYQNPMFINYSPQAHIHVTNNGNSFSVSAGGTLSNNTYKWFKAGEAGSTIITGDSVFYPSQPGTYLAKVTNAQAILLTLISDTINYSPAFTSTAVVQKNLLSGKIKDGQLIIFPNPVKNILHIQTTGKVTVSLADQSGKIILTKTISNKGEINVSQLPAGLYYLKNIATGEVLKIVVAK